MRLCDQLATLWPPSERPVAAAVCEAESHGDPNARCFNCLGVRERSRGLFQINGLAWPQYDSDELFDPETNARAAYEVWQRQGWQAWGAYTAGTYRQFLEPAPADGAALVGAPGNGLGLLAVLALAAIVVLEVL